MGGSPAGTDEVVFSDVTESKKGTDRGSGRVGSFGGPQRLGRDRTGRKRLVPGSEQTSG